MISQVKSPRYIRIMFIFNFNVVFICKNQGDSLVEFGRSQRAGDPGRIAPAGV
jgi:hypothetical protein